MAFFKLLQHIRKLSMESSFLLGGLKLGGFLKIRKKKKKNPVGTPAATAGHVFSLEMC